MRPLQSYIAAHSIELRIHTGVTGPPKIGDGFLGTGLYNNADTYSGGHLVLQNNLIAFASTSGIPDPIDFSMTFTDQTFDSIGIDVGRYQWTWGDADDGDFVILCAGVTGPCLDEDPATPAAATPVPSLATLGIFGLAGAIGAAGLAMTRQRKAGK